MNVECGQSIFELMYFINRVDVPDEYFSLLLLEVIDLHGSNRFDKVLPTLRKCVSLDGAHSFEYSYRFSSPHQTIKK